MVELVAQENKLVAQENKEEFVDNVVNYFYKKISKTKFEILHDALVCFLIDNEIKLLEDKNKKHVFSILVTINSAFSIFIKTKKIYYNLIHEELSNIRIRETICKNNNDFIISKNSYNEFIQNEYNLEDFFEIEKSEKSYKKEQDNSYIYYYENIRKIINYFEEIYGVDTTNKILKSYIYFMRKYYFGEDINFENLLSRKQETYEIILETLINYYYILLYYCDNKDETITEMFNQNSTNKIYINMWAAARTRFVRFIKNFKNVKTFNNKKIQIFVF